MTLRSFLADRYDDHLTTHGRSGTRNADMIRSAFGDLLERDLTAISVWDIEKWRSERLKAGRKPATCNRCINALRGAFSRAVEWELIDAHPMVTVKKQSEPEPDGERHLLPEEEARLRAALDAYDNALKARRFRRQAGGLSRTYGDETKPAVLLLMNLAARRNEVLGLRWPNVDLAKAQVTFPGANTKNGKSRTVPLPREALDVLTKLKAQARSEVFVFPNAKGDAPLRELKYWSKVRDAAKITRLRFRLHDTRHHVASRLVMAGTNLYSVSRVLGHRDTRMTARYSHLSPDHMRSVMAVLDVPNTIGSATVPAAA